ncbi:MAG: DeoR family transcriptional regulator [Lentisphaeria bacterium]|nr:DeoR family transcriptional regulator [Lentisphaeria bacterium]
MIRLMKENTAITIAEMANACEVSTRSIERNLKNLQNQGKLKRIGPDKGGY